MASTWGITEFLVVPFEYSSLTAFDSFEAATTDVFPDMSTLAEESEMGWRRDNGSIRVNCPPCDIY